MEFAADGAIIYFNDAAQKLALSVRKKHPRRSFAAGHRREIVRDCLQTRRSQIAAGNKNG